MRIEQGVGGRTRPLCQDQVLGHSIDNQHTSFSNHSTYRHKTFTCRAFCHYVRTRTARCSKTRRHRLRWRRLRRNTLAEGGFNKETANTVPRVQHPAEAKLGLVISPSNSPRNHNRGENEGERGGALFSVSNSFHPHPPLQFIFVEHLLRISEKKIPNPKQNTSMSESFSLAPQESDAMNLSKKAWLFSWIREEMRRNPSGVVSPVVACRWRNKGTRRVRGRGGCCC